MDLGFSTREVDVGKSTSREQVKGSGEQNNAKKLECENPEKAEPMLKDSNAESDKKFMEDISNMEKLIKDQVAKGNWQVDQGIKTAKRSWSRKQEMEIIVNQALQDLSRGTVWLADKGTKYSRSELSKVVGSICDNKDFVIKTSQGMFKNA